MDSPTQDLTGVNPSRGLPRFHWESPGRDENFHALAWLGWVAGTLIALSATRNPVYLGLILLCIGLVMRSARARAYAPPLPVSPVRFALVVITLSALFNALTAHFGATVLGQLPAWLPLLGGSVTLEALVYGALSGLVLTGFFAAFTVLYLALPIQRVIRLIPRAFYPVGVVLSIALAFVPTTLAQFGQIREAQLLRGHRVRGLRDWLPLFMPLLVSGLERALQLAEAMTARGFGSAPGARPGPARPILAAGLVALLAGLLLRLAVQSETLSVVLLLAGALLLIAALWLQGRGVARSIYRPQPWTRRDSVVTAAAALAALAYLLPLANRASLAYTPYPRLALPAVDLGVVIATAGLALPALLLTPDHRINQNGLPT